jgi:hypothetical protein
LLVASGSHGKFLSRLDLDVRGGEVKDFRYKLIPLFADAIAPDRRDGGGDRQGARAVRRRACARGRPHRVAALPARQFRRHVRRSDLRALIEERDAEIALSPASLGHERAPGAAITVADIHNATAITYPQVYRQQMTGARLKEILEDVADNLFNPDPYYQQGGDMVRCGGLGYSHRYRQADGEPDFRADALEIRQADRSGARLHGCRLGERERGYRRPAGVGVGREIRGAQEDRQGRGPTRRSRSSADSRYPLATVFQKIVSRISRLVERPSRLVL